MEYLDFLETKKINVKKSGFDVQESNLNPKLFDFQKFCVRKMLKNGKGAIFAGCGNGKTLMQLEWAKKVADREKRPVLILAPLSVSHQTIAEGNRFGYTVKLYRDMDEDTQIAITNYEQIDNIDNDLVELLAKRMRVCREIGQYKKEHNIQVLQTGRYNEILDKRGVQGSLTGMSSDFIKQVFEHIHEESVRQQLEIVNQ